MNVCKIAGLVANSADPDQTPLSVVSDLGLKCSLRPVCPNMQGNLIKSNPLRNRPGHNPALWYHFWMKSTYVTKTYLYTSNFDPVKPYFYIVKLGFTGVYIIFLISAQNIYCGYSLEPPRRGGSNEYPQSMFWAEIGKISEFFICKFSVFGDEIFYIFEYTCFCNVWYLVKSAW